MDGDFYRPILPYLEAGGLNKAALRANRAQRLAEMRRQGVAWDTAEVSVVLEYDLSVSTEMDVGTDWTELLYVFTARCEQQ